MEKEKDLSIRGVISTNPDLYQALQSNIQEIVAGEKRKMFERRFVLPLTYPDFQSLFQSFGNACLYSRNQNRDFVIDKFNEPIIEQLYLYVTNDSAFGGDLGKGIVLQGKYGCGKTVLLETYSLLYNHIIKNFVTTQPLSSIIENRDSDFRINQQFFLKKCKLIQSVFTVVK